MNPPGRQCGDCTLCCKLMIVPELAKPKDQWCRHCNPGRGCSIYGERPHSCRVFACQWLEDGQLGDAWQPNKCKMVVEVKDMKFAVHIDPGAQQPWRAEPYFSQLMAIAAHGMTGGLRVVIIERGRTFLMLPSHCVDLGIVKPDDRIWAGQVMTADGPRWDARVVGPG